MFLGGFFIWADPQWCRNRQQFHHSRGDLTGHGDREAIENRSGGVSDCIDVDIVSMRHIRTAYLCPEGEDLELIAWQYAYSAWAPGFAERLKLSSTQSNLLVCHTSKLQALG